LLPGPADGSLSYESVQPPRFSKQPLALLFSATVGDPLLPGFVWAWLSGGCG